MTGAVPSDLPEPPPDWESEANYLAHEIRRALGILKSVDWILRVHRKTPKADFGDEELATVVELISGDLNEALLPSRNRRASL